MAKRRSSVYVSEESIRNMISELKALRSLVIHEDDQDSANALLDEGVEEIAYNIELLLEGVEYLSDEFSYRAEKVKECE